MTIRTGIVSTDREDLHRWLEWGAEGDVIRVIQAPQETYQLCAGALGPDNLFMLSAVLNKGDLALIRCKGEDLVLMPERMFNELAGVK